MVADSDFSPLNSILDCIFISDSDSYNSVSKCTNLIYRFWSETEILMLRI